MHLQESETLKSPVIASVLGGKNTENAQEKSAGKDMRAD